MEQAVLVWMVYAHGRNGWLLDCQQCEHIDRGVIPYISVATHPLRGSQI